MTIKNKNPLDNPLVTVCALLDLVCCASPKDTHGPLVKTGPTAGQNRSRNKDGRWRKKRSDAGQPRTRA